MRYVFLVALFLLAYDGIRKTLIKEMLIQSQRQLWKGNATIESAEKF